MSKGIIDYRLLDIFMALDTDLHVVSNYERTFNCPTIINILRFMIDDHPCFSLAVPLHSINH